MNQVIKQKWLDKLRSGDYRQGYQYLNNDGKYCCLGVLCEVAVEAGVIKREASPFKEGVMTYGDDEEGFNDSLLPYSVVAWAGLKDDNPEIGPHPLSLLNDRDGWSFPEIATAIEGGL